MSQLGSIFTESENRLLDEIESHELDCKCEICMEFVNSRNPSEWIAAVRARLGLRSE